MENRQEARCKVQLEREEINGLRRLEESLWKRETRFDREYMERILSPDYIEFGRSGRIYNREETLTVPDQEINACLPLADFRVIQITSEVVLITYTSEVKYNRAVLVGNRSSIWVKTEKGWQLRFHQGTPVERG
ncbi:MAG: DUF4440 domain-containing protein [Bacteroidetes bacterium]|nr:DUF4440 domain-containing protein [Bacteroidota bacterium]